MLLLRTSLLIAASLIINTTMASEMVESTVPSYSQEQQPLLLAEKFGNRRRGNCGISPDVWALNICDTGPFCYTTAEKVSLWLPENNRSGRTDKLVIKNTVNQEQLELRWPASQATLAWPANQMPISSGTPYLIQVQRSNYYKEITLYKIPENLSETQRAEWMKRQGCLGQVETLVEEQEA